jgi:hypothetical protein
MEFAALRARSSPCFFKPVLSTSSDVSSTLSTLISFFPRLPAESHRVASDCCSAYRMNERSNCGSEANPFSADDKLSSASKRRRRTSPSIFALGEGRGHDAEDAVQDFQRHRELFTQFPNDSLNPRRTSNPDADGMSLRRCPNHQRTPLKPTARKVSVASLNPEMFVFEPLVCNIPRVR